jgi:uncharacterized protein
MASIKESLKDFNHWWEETFLFKDNFVERDDYKEILKFMQEKQIIALSGLRRVGKTTIMLKLAEDSIGEYKKQNILYFSFDEFRNVEIREVIRTYEEIMEKNIKNGKYVLLLDELQKLEDWQNQIKTIYDLHSGNVKIVISGSESLFIRKKIKESLTGRIFEFKIWPLSFTEFLKFRKFDPKPIGIHERELLQMFDNYMITQGFPELANKTDKEFIRKYINEGIVEKVIYTDIPKLFNITNVEILETILKPLLDEPGQIIELNSLSIEFGISRQTLSLYLHYLEDAFLIRKLYNFSANKRKTERKLKKYYPAVLSEDLLLKNDDLSKSKTFEWMVVRLLRAEFFWRDTSKHEVDIILTKDGIKPIEIKYGKINTTGIDAFMKKFKLKSGIIISRDKKEEITSNGRTINVIPAYSFFLAAKGKDQRTNL